MTQTHRFDHHRRGRILLALGLGVLVGLVLNVIETAWRTLFSAKRPALPSNLRTA